MRIVHTIAELQSLADTERSAGRRIALVPTMGALHAGHLSLIDAARARADRVWVSVFVNPTQFDDPSDLERYPRTFASDLQRCEAQGVDAVFAPDAAEMYPDGYQTHIDVTEIAREYAHWLSRSELKKLFVNAEPGTLLGRAARDSCRGWPNQTEVTVAGSHFVQEDSPDEIGQALARLLD